MKKIWLILISAIILILFCSCNKEPTVPPDKPELKTLISTENIQCNGWRDYISDSNYVISSKYFGTDKTSKINILTGNITDVCMRPNCDHSNIIFTNHGEHCLIPKDSSLFFIEDRKLYYKYYVSTIDMDELESTGSSKTKRTCIFAYYDITNGEYKELITIDQTDYEAMYNFIYNNGYIYYNRYIANTATPESADDFSLSLCRMSTADYRQEILLSLDNISQLKERIVPDLLAVSNNRIYFTCNETGQLYYIDMDSGKLTFLIDGKNGFLGIFDAYGTFFCDNYIYFTQYVMSVDQTVEAMDALFLYRVNCDSGVIEKLTNDYVRWLFVTDSHIFYEMSKTQPSKEQESEAIQDTANHTVKQICHNGDPVASWSITANNVQITGVWGAGESLYFMASFREDIPKDDGYTSIMDMYTIKYNISDGTVTEIGKGN